MNNNEKTSAEILLTRMAHILDVAEEVAEEILTDIANRNDLESLKINASIGDLIKLIQLLEKQYSLLKTVEKEQDLTKELPQANEQIIRNYLNNKHRKETHAEKVLRKGKNKHA